MNEGDRIILLRPNLWAGISAMIEKVVKDKTEIKFLVKTETGFHAYATAGEIEVI